METLTQAAWYLEKQQVLQVDTGVKLQNGGLQQHPDKGDNCPSTVHRSKQSCPATAFCSYRMYSFDYSQIILIRFLLKTRASGWVTRLNKTTFNIMLPTLWLELISKNAFHLMTMTIVTLR